MRPLRVQCVSSQWARLSRVRFKVVGSVYTVCDASRLFRCVDCQRSPFASRISWIIYCVRSVRFLPLSPCCRIHEVGSSGLTCGDRKQHSRLREKHGCGFAQHWEYGSALSHAMAGKEVYLVQLLKELAAQSLVWKIEIVWNWVSLGSWSCWTCLNAMTVEAPCMLKCLLWFMFFWL